LAQNYDADRSEGAGLILQEAAKCSKYSNIKINVEEMIVNKILLKLITGLSLTILASTALASSGGGDETCDANAKPFVLVHGWNGSNSQWDTIVDRFVADGYERCSFYRFGWSSIFDDNASAALSLASFVADVRADHNNQQVTVLAHSNGGLITRQFRVFGNGNAAIDRFITLGAPHNGTTSAYACFNPSCTDMRPGSAHINALAGQGCDRSIWSDSDLVILPAESAKCGTNTQTVSVWHEALFTDAVTYQDIKDNL